MVLPPLAESVSAVAARMDDVLASAREVLAAAAAHAAPLVDGAQARLVSAGLLSPGTDARLALGALLLGAYLLVKLTLLRLLAALVLAGRVPAVHVDLTPAEADLHPPGGTWVRARWAAVHTRSVARAMGHAVSRGRWARSAAGVRAQAACVPWAAQ